MALLVNSSSSDIFTRSLSMPVNLGSYDLVELGELPFPCTGDSSLLYCSGSRAFSDGSTETDSEGCEEPPSPPAHSIAEQNLCVGKDSGISTMISDHENSCRSHDQEEQESTTDVCEEKVEERDDELVCADICTENNTTKEVCSVSKKHLDARPKEIQHNTATMTGATRKKNTQRQKATTNSETNTSEYNSREKVSQNRKKQKKQRVKSQSKWSALCADDFGFHFSLLPRLYADDPNDEDIHTTDAPSSNASNCPDIDSRDESDDVAFFRSLGIDVLSQDNEIFDEYTDWDQVSFDQNSMKTKPIAKEKSRTDTKGNFSGKTREKAPNKNTAGPKKPLSTLCFKPEAVYPTLVKSEKLLKTDTCTLFELECSSSSKKIHIRRDKHRRVQKAHKAVKSKNCTSIFNNKGRKRLYMHHRLVKMHGFCLDFRQYERKRKPRMPTYSLESDVFKSGVRASTRENKSRPAPVQNLAHAIDSRNLPNFLENDLANFLISLQHREMTPEDYEMLLRLDDSVPCKTVSEDILKSFKTQTIPPEGLQPGQDDIDPVCAICMEPYAPGQERKFLPCEHDFHTPCIDQWLNNSSMNCPLDGLPVGPS